MKLEPIFLLSILTTISIVIFTIVIITAAFLIIISNKVNAMSESIFFNEFLFMRHEEEIEEIEEDLKKKAIMPQMDDRPYEIDVRFIDHNLN